MTLGGGGLYRWLRGGGGLYEHLGGGGASLTVQIKITNLDCK